MLAEICLYLELLVFLAGTLLYGFLTRELLRQPRALWRSRPLRALLIGLTIWYGGALIDEFFSLLLGGPPSWLEIGLGLDLLRAFAWLASFSLLAHTLIGFQQLTSSPLNRQRRVLTAAIAYAPLLLFLHPAWSFAQHGEPILAAAIERHYPLVLLHASITLVLAAVLTLRLLKQIDDERLAGFMKLLMGVLALLFGILVIGAFFNPWAADASGLERVLRTVFLAGLLLPGGLFAFYVQRYNLFRLSLSHSTLRHFLAVLLLVGLVMAAGPTLARDNLEIFRRFVAWGLLLALFAGTAYRPLMRRAQERSTALRRLLGKNVTPQELDHLMATIQQLDLAEADALARTAEELGLWLGGRAEFLPTAGDGAFWDHFAGGDNALIHRLDPPSAELAEALRRHDLHAVFALRVEGRLTGVLGLSASPTGGGYDDDELEAVKLVMRQLAGTLALRRLVKSRVDEERRLAEHERLGMLGLVTASLAHELKNPLSSMRVLAQSLREDLALDNPASENVAEVDLTREQIDRLHLTASELLRLARPPGADRTDLKALVESALYVLQAEARKRGVELVAAELGELGEVPGSVASWQTVIFNLVLNAVERTPAGERATVSLERGQDGGHLLFTTTNPGKPVPPELARHLFEPFVSEGGTGLGLALVARRLGELAGQIELDHDAEQVIFRVTAPLVASGYESPDERNVAPPDEPRDASVAGGSP